MNFIPGDPDMPFVSDQVIPDRFSHLLIRNDEQRHYSGAFGDVISQAIITDDFHIWQHYFFIEHPVLLCPHTEQTIYMLNYMLKGTISCGPGGPETISIKEGNYSIYCVPPVLQKIYLSPGTYRSVHINLPDRVIKELAPEFGYLKGILERHHTAASAPATSFAIDHAIQILLQDILQNKQKGIVRHYFLEARVRDLILLFVRDITNFKNEIFYVDKVILEEVRVYISDNIHNPLTIDSLAKRFGINRVTLSKHFKSFFGISLHKYLIECRMKKALLLLAEKRPIHELANLTGYPDTASFTKAFTLYYSKSPSAYRIYMENNSL